MNKEGSGKKAQMLLMSGILISAVIIAIASLSANLANVGVKFNLEKRVSPLEEYSNVREVFITVFNNSCSSNNSIDIWNAFNYTKDILRDIESRYANSFYAELRNISSTSSIPSINRFATIYLRLKCKKTTISEEIKIPIYPT